MTEYVRKRNGSLEIVTFDKVADRIKYLCQGVLRDGTTIGPSLNINYTKVAKDVISKIVNGISTSELDNFAANFCASLAKDNYQYNILGGRIAVSNHQKNTLNSFTNTVRFLYDNKTSDGSSHHLIDQSTYKFIMRNSQKLEEMIDYLRDYKLDYFGFMTLLNSYLLKRHDKPINVSDHALCVMERPQDMYMRIAIGVHMRGENQDLLSIKATYDALSLGQYSHASPTMFNAGTHYPQLSSCYLLGVSDSMDDDGSIPDCWAACARISKRAGGIGVGINNIRGRGTYIAGTGGLSDGIVPLARVFNDIGVYVNQGGRRPGAIALYIEPWHTDINDFLELRKQHGIETARARDLFTGLWIPDLFMKRVDEALSDTSKIVLWSIMCPHECPGLVRAYGEEFEKLYCKYETERRYKKQVNIRTLWDAIVNSQIETGTPYMLYKDSINRKNNQSNVGTICNSNLCAEIVEYSDESEYAVCNLASINLLEFISEQDSKKTFDFQLLYRICTIAMRNLNNIIDINRYPVEKCRKSNLRHRPVGLGVQALADVFLALELPFENVVTIDNSVKRVINAEARQLNRDIFETIYFACITTSMELARERQEPMERLRTAYRNGQITFNRPLDATVTVNDPELLQLIKTYRPIQAELERDSYLGTYSTFIGSPASKGLLQYDLWNVQPTTRWDWTTLKENIAQWGLRNSLTTAVMPTASTAQILGNSECIEPYKFGIYTRRVSAGEFVVVNKFLHQELIKRDLWTDEIQRQIIKDRGSVRNIGQLPQEVRDRFMTAFEISKKTIQMMSADRGAFIDQTQSLNIFVDNPTTSIMTNIHLGGWKMGLKTGMYYLKREPAEQPIQFTAVGMTVQAKACSRETKDCVSCSA